MKGRPYIPHGITQQGRLKPTKLTERHLNLQTEAKRETRGLIQLLIEKGAIEPPPPRPGPLRRLWLWFIRRG
jgi:hypothetical protein